MGRVAEWWGKRPSACIKTNFQNFKTLETKLPDKLFPP